MAAAGGAGESTLRGGAGDRGRRGRCLPASHGRIGGTGREGGEGGPVAGKRRSLPLRRLGHRAEGRVARFGREAGAGSEGRGRGGLPKARRIRDKAWQPSTSPRPHSPRPSPDQLRPRGPERDIGFERGNPCKRSWRSTLRRPRSSREWPRRLTDGRHRRRAIRQAGPPKRRDGPTEKGDLPCRFA